MSSIRTISVLALASAVGFGMHGTQLSGEVTQKIDAAIAGVYQAASAKFPCKIGTRSRSRVMKWQEVDKCINGATARVDWDSLIAQLRSLRPRNVMEGDFAAAVEEALTRHALPYEKVFLVKHKEPLLPLTNSVLKYLPPGGFMDLPVFELSGKEQVGVFAGVFVSERTGGLSSARPAALTLFQFSDPQGRMQVPSERLLLDSYSVPWNNMATLPGFRITDKRLAELQVK